MTSVYDLSYTDTQWNTVSMADYRSYVILIVNTATGCGLTPQFVWLESLYQRYRDQKFVVIGFPCNQFAGQEQVTDDAMVQTCALNYGVRFPLSQKIDVNGKHTHPIYQYLKTSIDNGIRWTSIKRNFSKFLIDRHGKTIQRYAPTTTPDAIAGDIIALL